MTSSVFDLGLVQNDSRSETNRIKIQIYIKYTLICV